MIRVLLVDDHPAILGALSAAVEAANDLTLVGTANAAEAADEAIVRADPDVVVCDVQLPGDRSGLSLLEHYGRGGRPAFLMVSGFETPSIVRAAFELGAAGYLPKSVELDEVVAAIHIVAAGGTAFSADILRVVRTALRRPSERELQVVRLVAAGASNGEIGLNLDISEKTVESHLRRMFDRYDVVTRTELALLAVREGWIADPAS